MHTHMPKIDRYIKIVFDNRQKQNTAPTQRHQNSQWSNFLICRRGSTSSKQHFGEADTPLVCLCICPIICFSQRQSTSQCRGLISTVRSRDSSIRLGVVYGKAGDNLSHTIFKLFRNASCGTIFKFLIIWAVDLWVDNLLTWFVFY